MTSDQSTEYTLNITRALLSDTPFEGIAAAAHTLARHGLTPAELNNVSTVTIGHLSGFLIAFTPEGIAKQKLRAAAASATSAADITTAIQTLPGTRRTSKKGHRK